MSNLAMVALEKIWWDKRYRTELGDIETLIDSIKEKGVLQPITVTPEFELLAGERRVTAARAAGLSEIPALVRPKADAIDAREIELMENLVRLDFTWNERVRLTQEIDRLYKEKNIDWSGRKTAQLLGRSAMSISRDLQLANSLDLMPELGGLKTADEALKVVKKMEEQAIMGELRKRQAAQMITGDGLEKGIKLLLEIADANYQIGDTLKELVELPSGSTPGWTRYHIIECDPPYGIDLIEQKSSKDSATSNVHTYNEVDREKYPHFLRVLAKELFRIAGTNTWLVFWFGPTWQREVLEALRGAGWLVDEIPAIWAKTQGQTLQPELYFARGYEPFYLARKGSPVLVKRGRLNVFNYPGVPGSQKYHPTERPIALIEEILSTLGAPLQTVLVPFLGSGATLRAAYNLGMGGQGWDLNPEYKDKFMLAVEHDARHLNNEPDEDDEIALDDGDLDLEGEEE